MHPVGDLLSTPLHNDIAALKKSIKGHLKVKLDNPSNLMVIELETFRYSFCRFDHMSMIVSNL